MVILYLSVTLQANKTRAMGESRGNMLQGQREAGEGSSAQMNKNPNALQLKHSIYRCTVHRHTSALSVEKKG